MEWFLFILIGIFTGTIAGMLGIGGGVLVVPALAFAFTLFHFNTNYIMQMAISTSLSIMIFTAIANVIARQKRKDIIWPICYKTLPSIIIGTIFGSLIVHHLSTSNLRIIFGCFLFLLAIQMLFDFKINRNPPKKISILILSIAGVIIGLKSGLLGLGGGVLSVPFFSFYGLSMKKAAGTTTVFTLAVSLVGTISLFLLGYTKIAPLGYIYWPALIIIAPLTIIFVPIGAKLSHVVKENILRTGFAILLALLSFKMLLIK